jgi:hypothetical protein
MSGVLQPTFSDGTLGDLRSPGRTRGTVKNRKFGLLGGNPQSHTERDRLGRVAQAGRHDEKEREATGLAIFCTLGPRSSESDTEPSVLRQIHCDDWSRRDCQNNRWCRPYWQKPGSARKLPLHSLRSSSEAVSGEIETR